MKDKPTTFPVLEKLAKSTHYGDLPETWRVPDDLKFSGRKSLYAYQTDALKNAARALYMYYKDEAAETNEKKEGLASLYPPHIKVTDEQFSVKKYETQSNREKQSVNPVYKILSEYFEPKDDAVSYHHLINRMCFWMATGSGKTLVMVKLIEYLHFLRKHRKIPGHNILILAPSDQLIAQIKRTVNEFNQSGLHITLVPLRDIHKQHRRRHLGDEVVVYYHRSDNISDVHKDALTDYRQYENGGKWYVILDEAHKGGKENSKRQAYYAVMAREGFLFNFSATFTDREDIFTTVIRFDLHEFINNGYGKNIYLNKEEYTAFKRRGVEINHTAKLKIVLKSLITLAYVAIRAECIRKETGILNLYHRPLMLTLVNSVNTEAHKNDLWAFFTVLRDIANGDIPGDFFKAAKKELINDWRINRLLFGGINNKLTDEYNKYDWESPARVVERSDVAKIKNMKLADLRKAVFLSHQKGALQIVRSKDNKELAFQLRNAAAPFALIRIGDTSKWRKDLLAQYDEGTVTLRSKSFFADLEKSNITIFMGSRSFFESWDSNRPNVINFINIGGADAKKFVMQSVGRGVRIEPFPGVRRRLSFLSDEKLKLPDHQTAVKPLETLFLFATDSKAMEAALERMENEKNTGFELLKGFKKAPPPEINGGEMPLLVPEYKEATGHKQDFRFSMSGRTRERFRQWISETSDSVFAIRDGLTAPQIAALRQVVTNEDAVAIKPGKDYAMIPFLQQRLLSHLATKTTVSDSVRPLDESEDGDIVHFRRVRVESQHAEELREKIIKAGMKKLSEEELEELWQKRKATNMSFDYFYNQGKGTDREDYNGLIIKKVVNHYYLPVVLGNDAAGFIKHIIKVESEVRFLNALEEWVASADSVGWDGWMFSKIDESLDKVYIPYVDESTNTYRKFNPDFIFWMCRGNRYRIVLVDPKGAAHTAAQMKIDGYEGLFMKNAKERIFKHRGYEVSVGLLFYNPDASPSAKYKNFWINHPKRIFENPPN